MGTREERIRDKKFKKIRSKYKNPCPKCEDEMVEFTKQIGKQTSFGNKTKSVLRCTNSKCRNEKDIK